MAQHLTWFRDDLNTDGPSLPDITSAVMSAYNRVTGDNETSVDASLDDLEPSEKDKIIGEVSSHFNLPIDDTSSIHTCNDLIQYVYGHDAQTTSDILRKNTWVRDEFIAGCEQLWMLKTATNRDYSTEGFITKIGDCFLAMANAFKTNIFKFWKSLKRSEIHTFSDSNVLMAKQVDGTDFTTFMDVQVDQPTGMKCKYVDAVEAVKGIYEQLDAYNYICTVAEEMKGVQYKLFNNQMNFSSAAFPLHQQQEKNKTLAWAEKIDTACYPSRTFDRPKFKQVYASMHEFASVRKELLDLEIHLQNINSFVDKVDGISSALSDMQTHTLQLENVPKQFITQLAEAIRLTAKCADVYGQNCMRQLALEHNQVINYYNLYKLL